MADLQTTQNPKPEGLILTDSGDDQTEKKLTESSITSTKITQSSDVSIESLPNVLPELCEFAPLDFILQQLPQKAQRAKRALTAISVEFTCMDANKDFIVLGANFSMVFVYDRCENSIIKLKCDDRNCRITCVKILTSLDHQIAVGTSTGQVEIYLLPAKRPGQINKELKKFLVDGGHRSNVTCAEWSANGMKLFTGDSIGNVVYTGVDFYENKCHSEHILKEEMPIVQLNYAHKILIISTYSRTVLCHTVENCRLQQVGQQPRKSKGYFGGHFVPALCTARDAIVCATRPGLRLWRANTEGTVLETLKFKDLLAAQHQTIMVLPATRQQAQSATDQQFGPVLFYSESYILTWSHNLLVVLDMVGPIGARVVASSLGDLGSIISVATCGSEIYVLRRGLDRPLIRIATEPEVFPQKEHISLAETELLKVSRPGDTKPGGTNSNTSSPSLQRKDRGASIKQGLFAVKTLFSKAKEEIVDTTAKLRVPKFGKLDQEDGHSAGSSRRGSQDSLTVVCQTPDATLSPEIIAAQFAARANETVFQFAPDTIERDHKVVEQSEEQVIPSKGPCAVTSDQTGLVPSGEAQAEENQLPSEHPVITLSDKKLLEIGQQSFDDDLVRPVKHSKKKKKKSTHKGKKDASDRSATPSPTPDQYEDSNGSSNFPKTHILNPRSESDKSRSDSVNRDSCIVRSDRSLSDSKEARPEILSSPGLEVVQLDSKDIGSDSLKMERGNKQTDRKNTEINTKTHQPAEVQELKNNRSATSREKSICSENMRTRNEQHKEDIKQAQSAKPEGVNAFSRGGLEMMVTGVVADSNENIETRQCSLIFHTLSPPNVIGVNDLPRTLKSWEGAAAMSQAHSEQTGRTHTNSTDSIHSLVSDIENIKLDLHKEVPTDAPGPHEQEPFNAEILPPAEMKSDKGTNVNKESALSKSDSTDDEFYGKYLSQSPSSDSSPPGFFGIEEADPPDVEEGMLEDTPIPENIQQRFAGSWMQCNTPGFIFQLIVSDKHIWCVDNKDRVYHSLVSNVSLKWNKLKESAMQIATSPSGNIVWRLHRRTNTAFACAPISPQSPIGTKWYEAAKGIIHICLDENIAWLVKNNGEIYVCKGISRDLPYKRPRKAVSDAFVTQIAANRGMVWAIGSNKKVMYRCGITRNKPEGTKWMDFEDESFKLRFASIALDSRNVGWGIDDEGLVWFRTGVTPNNPEGDDKKWWQVPMGEYLMQDPNTLKMLLNMAGTNATVDRMTNWLKRQYYRATHIAASEGSLWVCSSYHYKSSLHVSKGNLLGSRWESGCPVGLPLSAVWVTLSATGVYGPSGTIWAALKSGEVFCFPPDTRKPLQVDPPRAGAIFKHLSATADTLWALTEESNIYVRQRISERSPQGLSWKKLTLDQLGPCKLVHFSCGADVVWACDNEGIIYLRIGVDIPNDESLPAAWVPVDGKAVGYGAHFVQVFCSVDNRLVWAIDSKKSVYVRKGICDGLPLGLEWEVVEGTQAIHLCISSSTVWALCPNGDVACRFGITERNCVGDYWKKVPGSYTYLSVTQSDDLWALSSEGKLFQRFTKMFNRRGVPQIEQQESPLAEDDWELL